MLEYSIEELHLEDLEESVWVIDTTFRLFEAPDYSEEGIDYFFQFANCEVLFSAKELPKHCTVKLRNSANGWERAESW